MDFLVLVMLGIGVVLVTRVLLVRGLEKTSRAWRVPTKIQGQVMGYATSVPELVSTVATASRGLLGAGLWNIAASNIMNLFLFLLASISYGRTRALARRKFIDEIGFAVGSVGLPLLLVLRGDVARSYGAAVALFLFFLAYLVIDWTVNRPTPGADEKHFPMDHWEGVKGVCWIAAGVVGIVLLGQQLGVVAESIVRQLNVPEVIVGWVLGLVTSLPELTTFFSVFARYQGDMDDADCQQNLDNLAASNMSNIGLIYPLGIAIFLWVAV